MAKVYSKNENMMTLDQIDSLAKDFKIDRFSIVREYLQLLFLSYLYREKGALKIYFKGGTAIHLLLDSPRFSEDLDFSTLLSKSEIKKVLKKIEKDLQKELNQVKIILLYSGKKSIRFRLIYKAADFRYPFVIRLDFTEEKKPQKVIISPLVTKFPIVFFPLVAHFSPEEIIAEKIRAILTRGKGRDFFDLWFLLAKKIDIDERLVETKLREVGKKFNKSTLIKKIQEYPTRSLERDLNQFLPATLRKIIVLLKKEIISELSVKWVNNWPGRGS